MDKKLLKSLRSWTFNDRGDWLSQFSQRAFNEWLQRAAAPQFSNAITISTVIHLITVQISPINFFNAFAFSFYDESCSLNIFNPSSNSIKNLCFSINQIKPNTFFFLGRLVHHMLEIRHPILKERDVSQNIFSIRSPHYISINFYNKQSQLTCIHPRQKAHVEALQHLKPQIEKRDRIWK